MPDLFRHIGLHFFFSHVQHDGKLLKQIILRCFQISGIHDGKLLPLFDPGPSAQLQLPWDQVTGASKSADQYPYLSMPEENGDGLEIRASADSSGQGENLVFVSADQGESWQFTGVREE